MSACPVCGKGFLYDDSLLMTISHLGCVEKLIEENAGLRSHQACTKRAEQAEVELAALKRRRCDECSGWHNYEAYLGQGHCRPTDCDVDDDFACNRWEARP